MFHPYIPWPLLYQFCGCPIKVCSVIVNGYICLTNLALGVNHIFQHFPPFKQNSHILPCSTLHFMTMF